MSGSSTFINNWAAAFIVQVAQSVAAGSKEFVVLAMALESVAVVAIMVIMSLTRRHVAAPWTRAIATWLAAAGMLAPALAPSRISLLLGFLALAWMGQSVYTLRSVISDAPGDLATDGQHRVQAWVYRVLLGFQLAYVGIASATGSWRYANVAVAGVLVVEGAYLLVGSEMRRADPRKIHQPGADQSLLTLIRYRPVFWAVLSVTASYVVSGVFFARAQIQFTTLGWSASTASWIVVAVAATRALTFRRRPSGQAEEELEDREVHHGRALVFSGGVMALSAAALGVTLLPLDAVAATTALIAAGVLFQFGMNRSNPIVREYVAERSVDASNWLNLGGMLGVAVGGVLPAFMSWPWLVATCAACAAFTLGIARATMGHRYETDAWRPLVPAATVYEFAGTWERPYLRFEIRPGGRGPLPQGFDPIPPYAAGLGVPVMIKTPINSQMEHQYWPSRKFLRILWRSAEFDTWMRRRMRRTAGRTSILLPGTDPELVLLVAPDLCLVEDPSGSWFVDLNLVVPHAGILATGLGRAPYMGGDRVRAEITYEGVTRWELCVALNLPKAVYEGTPLIGVERWAPVTPSGLAQLYEEPAYGGYPARWVIPASALDLPRTVFTRVHGDFKEGTLVATPLHH